MTRGQFIERIRREVYGGYVPDDAEITEGLVNSYINDAIGIAVKQNYKESIQLDGIGYVNNSFYTTFKGISVTQDETFLFKMILPELPIGIGRNEGVSSLQFKDDKGLISRNCIPISIAQKNYYLGLRQIPNKILYYPEGKFVYAISILSLVHYTASIGMISGGDANDLDSDLNVAPEYLATMEAYIMPILMKERSTPKVIVNDGTP